MGELQLSAQISGWKDQWSKLHPELQVAQRELVQLKKRADHQDTSMQSQQQGISANANGVSTVHGYCAKLAGDMQKLHHEVVGACSILT